MSGYTIRRIRCRREQNIVNVLHAQTFPLDSPIFPLLQSSWIAWLGKEAVGFIYVQKAKRYPSTVYLCRVGVSPDHRGHGLQVRMTRVMEKWARKQGYTQVVSDTTNNPPSEKSFEKLGYVTFNPTKPWGLPGAKYWCKAL